MVTITGIPTNKLNARAPAQIVIGSGICPGGWHKQQLSPHLPPGMLRKTNSSKTYSTGFPFTKHGAGAESKRGQVDHDRDDHVSQSVIRGEKKNMALLLLQNM